MMKVLEERDAAHVGTKRANFRTEDIANSAEYRKAYEFAASVVAPEDQPFENSPDGLIKHLVHEKMNTREHCVDAYMQFIQPGSRTGKHRHMWEEVIFVAEGSGYDLHWDVKFDCLDKYEWDWETEPKKSEWTRGDFIYIPPFSIHQHFNTGTSEARLIVISNRIVKAMGFNWLDQVEKAPGA
jgi:quercetin dioxygenase-like cupin family protein